MFQFCFIFPLTIKKNDTLPHLNLVKLCLASLSLVREGEAKYVQSSFFQFCGAIVWVNSHL